MRGCMVLALFVLGGCTPLLPRHPEASERAKRLGPLIEALDQVENHAQAQGSQD